MSRRIELENGAIYEGGYEGGVMTGNGRLSYADGGSYVGEFKEDSRWGTGTFTSATGEIYEGEWASDKRSGRGKMTFADGSIYEGSFMNDKRDYKGKMKWANGDAYDGKWTNDKRNGAGKLVYADGSVYEGAWKDDKRVGAGKLVDGTGSILHEGDWDNDKPKQKLIITPAKPRGEGSTAPTPVSASMVSKMSVFSPSALKSPEPITPDKYKPYAILKEIPTPADVDVANKELYLDDAEFESLFGCNKEEFAKLPKWRRDGKKKELNLY